MLAALLYRLVADLRKDLQTSLRNYALRFRRAQAAGAELTIPRVADLLADPAFVPLAQWLRQREAALEPLQAAVDDLFDQLRQVATSA